MQITIRSKNDVKINAVKELSENHPIFKSASFFSKKISSEISDQPLSIEETMKSAMNLAKNCFEDSIYSFGIEDGLIKVPNTKTDYKNVCCCVIFDGKEFHFDLSSAFEYPKQVTKLVLKDKLNIKQAYYKVGLTNNPKIGRKEGVIGILTNG